MNHLVIIGNGFDRAHDLNTSYIHFMVWYLNKAIKKFNATNSYEDKLFKIEIKIGEFGYRNIQPIKEIIEIQDFKIHTDNPNISVTKSVFLKSLIEKGTAERWVDIEAVFYELLKKNYSHFKKSAQYLELQKKLNGEFDEIKIQLEEYLKGIQNVELKKINEIQEIFESYKSKDIYLKNSTHILNFNYTNTVEKYITKFDKEYEINYIHGKLNDPINPLIFGYGDETDEHYSEIEKLNENIFLEHFKSFGYFKTPNYQNLLRFIDSDKFEVSIMGHSCGLSDRVMLKNIFEHSNCVKIKIYYYSKKGSNNYTKITQEISRHFSDKSRMRKIIVNLTDSEPLPQVN